MKPYTDADVELVASTFVAEAKKNPIEPATPPWLGAQTRMLLGPTEHDIARAVLEAVAGRIRAQAFREAADMVANCKPESTNRDFLRALEAFQMAIAAGLRISANLTESAQAKP